MRTRWTWVQDLYRQQGVKKKCEEKIGSTWILKTVGKNGMVTKEQAAAVNRGT